MNRMTPTAERQDEGAARAFVAGMFAYAILMICLFALPRADLLPAVLAFPGLN